MSVAEFVAGVDRLLTRGHGLFPAGGAGEGGRVFAAGGGRGPVPAAPGGGSSLTGGARPLVARTSGLRLVRMV